MTQILLNSALVWAIAALTILLILIRPRHIPEAVWAACGALVLVILRLLSPRDALTAIGRGTDVYLFLTGMMLLAELARREGFFDWVAQIAVARAQGSPALLFAIVYAVGTVVTIFLSNDATAVVLTPAVLAAVRKARANPLPYLLICAFIANAASFVLPISNPANLVLYGSHLPPLGTWFATFGLASAVAIAVTYFVLRASTRASLAVTIESTFVATPLSPAGRRAAFGIAASAIVLLAASALHFDLGLPTLLAALGATALVAMKDRGAPLGILRHVSWSVLPLVAGLFVLVEATNRAGALRAGEQALQQAAVLPPVAGALASAFGVALLSNVVNNLPVGLLAAGAVNGGGVPTLVRNAVLIGVDLGPNLSISGSLATILWLATLRREGEEVSFGKFLRFGIMVMPPALVLSVLALLLTKP